MGAGIFLKFIPEKIGACPMTTKFLDNKIALSNFIVVAFPRKTAFLTIFLSAPRRPPPSKSENFIFIVVSPSLKNKMVWCNPRSSNGTSRDGASNPCPNRTLPPWHFFLPSTLHIAKCCVAPPSVQNLQGHFWSFFIDLAPPYGAKFYTPPPPLKIPF